MNARITLQSIDSMTVPLWRFAEQLAKESSDVQAEFFNDLYTFMKHHCKDHYHLEMQLQFIKNDLNKDTREHIALIWGDE